MHAWFFSPCWQQLGSTVGMVVVVVVKVLRGSFSKPAGSRNPVSLHVLLGVGLRNLMKLSGGSKYPQNKSDQVRVFRCNAGYSQCIVW